MPSGIPYESLWFKGRTKNRSASAPRLPGEIVDRIVDFLFDDRPALINCSLVCRALTSACRYHLYKVVGINWSDVDTMTTFFDPTSGIAPYVQELSLYEFPPIQYHTLKHTRRLFENLIISYRLSRLSIQAESFKALRHLRLTHRWKRSPSMLALIRQLLPQVDVLTFTKFHLEVDSIEMISMAVHLLELNMRSFILLANRPPQRMETGVLAVPSNLHTLRCSSFTEYETVLVWISRSPNISSLRTLELYPSAQYHAPALSELIQKLGTSLQHIILSVWSFTIDPLKDDGKIHGTSLACNTGIKTITFRRGRCSDHYTIANVLGRIPTTSLNRIIIENLQEPSSMGGHDLLELLNDPSGNFSRQGVILQFKGVIIGSLAHSVLQEEYQVLDLQKRLEFNYD